MAVTCSSPSVCGAIHAAPEAHALYEPRIAEIAAEQFRERQNARPVPVKPLFYRAIKRAIDVAVSSLAIAVFFVPGALLSVVIMRDTGGSPFYLQTRVGKGGRLFKIVKFRTMVADSDNLRQHFTEQQMRDWVYEHKVERDPRITKLGAFLRRTSIDEIPNFINAFLGQMSIVGPRAVTPEELVWYGEDVDLLPSVPAGITGMWQVESRNEARYQTGERQALELDYVRNACLGLDVKIFFQTFAVIVSKTGS
ncbi:MAG: sugar transferase [Eggerthellaceae bacterium]|nr:sugar transferase [Eggerthellaceae bacterium]